MKETKAKSELTLEQVRQLAREKSYRNEKIPVLRWEDVEELGLLSKTLHKQNNRLLKEGEKPVARYWIRGTRWVDVYHISQTVPSVPLTEKQKQAKEKRKQNATCKKCSTVAYPFSENRILPLEKDFYLEAAMKDAQQNGSTLFPTSLLKRKFCGKCRRRIAGMYEDLCTREKQQFELIKRNPKKTFLWQTLGTSTGVANFGEILEIMVMNLDKEIVLHQRIKPKEAVHPKITMEYGYTNQMLNSATRFKEVYAELISYMKKDNLFLMYKPSQEIGMKFKSSYFKNKAEIASDFMSDKEEFEKEDLAKFFDYRYCPTLLKEEFVKYLNYPVKADDPNSFKAKMLMLHGIMVKLLKEDVWKHPKWTHFLSGWGINE
ncbi:hypothetical protein ABEY96_28185 [Priestia aryabhattai]|uniref:hypothetical protein n=1 Tax=Priestia aryabhattai TaxID=412384 RepID=UPI003D29CF24